MNQEVLIPKMTKPDNRRRKIRVPWTNIAVVLFGVLLICASTFINLKISHYIIPYDIFSGKKLTSDDFIFTFCLIPQIPMLMFVCSVLGKKMALTATTLYILIGLFLAPVFALGGGAKYISEYGFGYILAYIPAIVVAGNSLSKKYTYFGMTKAAIFGVLTIHLLGIIYMSLIALIRQSGVDFITGWIMAQSGLKIIYDIIASFILILIGKYLHFGLKFIIE